MVEAYGSFPRHSVPPSEKLRLVNVRRLVEEVTSIHQEET